MSQKSWTYEEITQATEDKIARLLRLAAGKPSERAMIFKDWAYGAYLGWYHLTCGWQEEGDAERMEAIAKGTTITEPKP
jgi:hypothetical protein